MGALSSKSKGSSVAPAPLSFKLAQEQQQASFKASDDAGSNFAPVRNPYCNAAFCKAHLRPPDSPNLHSPMSPLSPVSPGSNSPTFPGANSLSASRRSSHGSSAAKGILKTPQIDVDKELEEDMKAEEAHAEKMRRKKALQGSVQALPTGRRESSVSEGQLVFFSGKRNPSVHKFESQSANFRASEDHQRHTHAGALRIQVCQLGSSDDIDDSPNLSPFNPNHVPFLPFRTSCLSQTKQSSSARTYKPPSNMVIPSYSSFHGPVST